MSLSGIGNYLMHTPLIAEIKRQRPGWRITVWCAPRGQAVFARANPDIDEVIEAPIQSPFIKDLPLIMALRRGAVIPPDKGGKGGSRRPFDAAIMLSPGQLIKGAAYMFAAGIPQRLAHQYPFRGKPASSFLLTHSIPEETNIHDIEQNHALLPLLRIDAPLIRGDGGVPSSALPPDKGGRGGSVAEKETVKIHYTLHIPTENHQKAGKLLADLNIPISKPLIGLHPGSAPNAGYKRWPTERFAAVARALIEKHDAHILIFGGPDEEGLKNRLQNQIHPPDKGGKAGSHATLITSDLLTTAALTQKCRLFISNDSGLMHIAAAAGAPTLGLFGPTSETETGPRGPHSHTLRAPGTQPVYNTEANAALGDTAHESLLKLTPEHVLSKAEEILSAAR